MTTWKSIKEENCEKTPAEIAQYSNGQESGQKASSIGDFMTNMTNFK